MGAQTTQNRRPFVDALVEAIGRAGSPICVGLDPVLEKLPESVRAEHWEPPKAIEAFCTGVVDAVAGIAPVVKLQSACFERNGAAGVRVLEHVAAHARAKGVLVLLDAKRGDIGISAEHYAAAAVGLHADAITVSGYMGPSTIEPYLRAGLGVFVLVRTSNPDSDVVQGAALKDGRSVAGMMGEMVAELGKGWMGASEGGRHRIEFGIELSWSGGGGDEGGGWHDAARDNAAAGVPGAWIWGSGGDCGGCAGIGEAGGEGRGGCGGAGDGEPQRDLSGGRIGWALGRLAN
jgi:orotidine 5'-phosphate decarboxylase subfamily 2